MPRGLRQAQQARQRLASKSKPYLIGFDLLCGFLRRDCSLKFCFISFNENSLGEIQNYELIQLHAEFCTKDEQSCTV